MERVRDGLRDSLLQVNGLLSGKNSGASFAGGGVAAIGILIGGSSESIDWDYDTREDISRAKRVTGKRWILTINSGVGSSLYCVRERFSNIAEPR